MRDWIFPGKASSLNTKDFSSAADAQHFLRSGLPASHFGLAATAQVNQAIVKRLAPQMGQVGVRANQCTQAFAGLQQLEQARTPMKTGATAG